jgi:hypothetical protein
MRKKWGFRSVYRYSLENPKRKRFLDGADELALRLKAPSGTPDSRSVNEKVYDHDATAEYSGLTAS